MVWRMLAADPEAGEQQERADAQVDRAEAPRPDPSTPKVTSAEPEFGLSEWNRFEQELHAARQQADELDANLRRSADDSPRAPDPLAEASAELDRLEQRWNSGAP